VDRTAPLSVPNTAATWWAGRRLTLVRETHALTCGCSICRGLPHAARGSWGCLLPEDKVHNAWRWLFLVTRRGRHYLRWTGWWQRRGT